MTYAAITGWGKCMPPATLTNEDLSKFLDTNDEWITSRTGMKERRVSHVSATEMAVIAAKRALACAGIEGGQVDLIIYGSCSNDEQVPNCASGVQVAIGATKAASIDLNTACTSFLYSLTAATSMIRTGVAKTAVVIGVELISPFMDWDNRNVAVLFGDGCAAVVLQATDKQEGVLGEELGCLADARQTLRVRGMGTAYTNRGVTSGDTEWDFDGQEIFKRAVQRYGNMSAATVPVALAESLEEGRMKPGALVLMPAFGAGLTVCAHLVRWGDRVTPLALSDAELPPVKKSALDMVQDIRARKHRDTSKAGLHGLTFIEQS